MTFRLVDTWSMLIFLVATQTILSVPSYTIHHLESVWTDPFAYRPERWLEEGSKELEKALNVFSFGPFKSMLKHPFDAELTF